MPENTRSTAARRGDRLLREHVHDPYKTRLKLPEPPTCPDCGAVYRKGRWCWEEAPPDADAVRCQACHRIHDRYPAGEVTLGGAFLAGHATEIMAIIRKQDALEKAEHPLHRVMDIEEADGAIRVTTTDIHTPRRIGEAVAGAFDGNLEFHYDEESYFIRVRWTRDD